MVGFIGSLIPNLMIGAVVIAGIYFIYCLFELLGASSKSSFMVPNLHEKE